MSRPFLDERGRLLGTLNVFDAGLFVLVALVALGVLMVQSGLHATSAGMVKGETDIAIRVMFRIRSDEAELMKPGDTTNITVRNQPRGQVEVLEVIRQPVKEAHIVNGQRQLFENPNELKVQDYWVTLKDHAVITEEGYVAEGVKMKVGLPIDLEGFTYRVHGGITQVTPLGETPTTPTPKTQGA